MASVKDLSFLYMESDAIKEGSAININNVGLPFMVLVTFVLD